ncbi:hypothetical protein LTR37_007479 [Vermiconidia calcicola]|uniref:Uncharacterized protein n=1 Tax=Vermiconidia calcicola TaxID=1690605 RepID=A0ACC3NEP6_9PEZI|nr:hypothetical protein LTR37_007479 [Vermiconidia calcicola]
MHSIKKAARREAWYHNNDEENRTYNLWGRVDTRPKKKRDEETGLQHHLTENDAGPSPVEQARRRSYQNDTEQFSGPAKSGTFPGGPNGHMPRMEDKVEQPSDISEPSKESTDRQISAEQDGEVEKSVGPQDAEGKPRKRKMRKFMPWKKDDQEPEVERTDTEDSKKKKYPKLTVWSQVKAVFGSWINVLLIFVPVGIALEYAGIDKVIVFVVNFIAIIPLAAVLSYATEELALYVGEVLGGLLNASFGNAVELIVSIIALTQRKILIVQTSLIGSMLSNLLLVLGMCFFLGGINRTEQHFNVTVAQTAASLLALAIGSLIIPTAFRIFAQHDEGVVPTSRGTSVLLLVTYGCYLMFQLRTHVDMYNEPSKKSPKNKRGKKDKGEVSKGLATMGAGTGAAATGGHIHNENLVHEEEEEETPQLTRLGALITLALSTVLVALCAEYMVSSIDEISKGVSEEFIGLILLPIVGNAAEHATAVTVAIKDKMDLSIGVAVGSSLQIALLVLPIMVMLSWWGVPGSGPAMTLSFDGFQIAVLFIAVIVVNYLIQDGKSHWLEGVLLMITYLIIAIAAWFYPNGEEAAA